MVFFSKHPFFEFACLHEYFPILLLSIYLHLYILDVSLVNTVVFILILIQSDNPYLLDEAFDLFIFNLIYLGLNILQSMPW